MTLNEPFTQNFDSFVCEGDSIATEHDGFLFTSRIEFDWDCTPMDYDAEGCCFDTSDPEHGEENQKIIDAWRNDEWWYGVLIIEVSLKGIVLDTHAACVGGIEVNFPSCANSYLRIVANEMFDEAYTVAKDTLKELLEDAAA